MRADIINQLNSLEIKDGEIVGLKEKRPEIGMMVSLDHTIYFHDPKGFRADEWMCAEAETPWAGDGRGLVFQRIFSRDGKLIASCVQEVCWLRFFHEVRCANADAGCCQTKARVQAMISVVSFLVSILDRVHVLVLRKSDRRGINPMPMAVKMCNSLSIRGSRRWMSEDNRSCIPNT